jgi:hypothetical protein
VRSRGFRTVQIKNVQFEYDFQDGIGSTLAVKQIKKWGRFFHCLSLPKKIDRIVIINICHRKILRNDFDAPTDV